MKLRTYLRTLFNSLSSSTYYLDILNAPLSFSVRFFLMSYVLLTIFSTIMFSVQDIPQLRQNLERTLQQIDKNYPQDLELTWDGKTLQSNRTEPVEISYPEVLPPRDFPKTFGFIDPSSTGDTPNIDRVPKSSYFIVGKENLYFSPGEGEWSRTSLVKVPGFEQPFTMNRSTLPAQLQFFREDGQAFLTILPILFPFFFLFGVAPARFLFLAFEAVWIFFFIRLLLKQIPYRKVLQIVLHVGVVAEVLHLTTSLFLETAFPIYRIAFWVYMIIILIQLRHVREIRLGRRKVG